MNHAEPQPSPAKPLWKELIVHLLVVFAAMVAVYYFREFAEWVSKSVGGHRSCQRAMHNIGSFLLVLTPFLAGAILRRSRKGVLLILLAAGVVHGASMMGWLTWWSSWKYQGIPSAALLVFVAGVCELGLTRSLTKRMLVWLIPLAVAVAGLKVIVLTYWNWTGWDPFGYSWFGDKIEWVMWNGLLPLLFWLALLWLRRILQGRSKPKPFRATLILFVFAVPLFYHWGCYALAEASAAGGEWIRRTTAWLLLEERGRDSDFERLLAAVDEIDWAARSETYGDPRLPVLGILARHEQTKARAAAKYAKLLKTRPTRALAELTAKDVLVAGHFETVPIMFRYLLAEQHLIGCGSCAEELESVGIVEAGFFLLEKEWNDLCGNLPRGKTPPANFAISEKTRKRLIALVGRDVGNGYQAWLKVLNESKVWPAGWPEAVYKELDQEYDNVLAYRTLDKHLQLAMADLIALRIRQSGKEKLLACLAKGLHQYSRPDDNFVSWEDDALNDAWRKICDAARKELDALMPDINIPTAAAFAAEIKASIKRIDAFHKTYAPPKPPETPKPLQSAQ